MLDRPMLGPPQISTTTSRHITDSEIYTHSRAAGFSSNCRRLIDLRSAIKDSNYVKSVIWL
jgi:hypothetical protein